ncbi:MAG: HAD hydrolase family protein, partial [Eubacteriales bacterium]|nr:HAD hydrolase family protein [Eubacteriales bacterium]
METRKALVFFDIDGTLLDRQQQAPESAVQAIAQLRANGHLAFINTGRCMAMVSEEIQSIGFDGIVASCGTHITVGSQTLENILIPEDQLRAIIHLMIENRIDFWLEGPDHVYLDSVTHPAFYRKFLAEYPGWPGLFADFRTATPLRVNKFSYLINRHSRFDLVEPLLRDQFDLIVHREDHGEVIPKGFSKATGMDQVKAFLGQTDARIFA